MRGLWTLVILVMIGDVQGGFALGKATGVPRFVSRYNREHNGPGINGHGSSRPVFVGEGNKSGSCTGMSGSNNLDSDQDVAVDGTDNRVLQWIIDHDDSWLFIGSYVGLAVVLSIVISLFWLLVVVAIHGVFEWIRQSYSPFRDRWSIIARVGWELKLDVGLLMLALVLGVYMDVILGAAGLGSAARLGIQAGARFTGWQNILRGFLLSVDDAAHVVRALGRSAPSCGEQEEGDTVPPDLASVPRRWGGWQQPRWGVGDWLALTLLAVSTGLLVTSPWLSPHDSREVLAILAKELHPWP